MIQKFVDRFMANKPKLEAVFREKHSERYLDIVEAVIEAIHDPDELGDIDPKRIHEIDDGHYQGTLLYLIADNSYQPDEYWYVKVAYGSCSGCDTLQGINGYTGEKPTDNQVKEYMTLALHIVQGLKKLDDDIV
jgi:hypothetical protein